MGLGDLNLQSFTNRLIYQKKIYLLQLFGLDLGYRYNWHIRGPYAPDLAGDLFSLKEEIEIDEDNEFNEYELKHSSLGKIEQMNELWQKKPTEIDEETWAEVLASLHYLKHIAYWKSATQKTKDAVIDKLKDLKPRFKQKSALLEEAWQALSSFNLDKNKELTHKVR